MSLESFVEEIPEAYYRKAIDLNRYSNSVARELMESYERIVRRSIAELERIEQMPSAKRPKVRAQRLKALIKQNTEALAKWSNKSSQKLARELADLAKIEVDFTVGQLRRGVPEVARGAVRTVEVTPAFAESVITADPTNVGTSVLSDNLDEIVSGPGKAMKLTARQGAAIRMPNGMSIGKAFRGLAERQAQMFATTVQDGLLSGESTQSIASRLMGNLEFSTQAKSLRQYKLAKGQMFQMAPHQVSTLVRTTVNATSNVASQRVYKANPQVTKKYRWLATLDEKTSPICRSLDQQVFEYGKGPTPANPPHFNCRSTTVPVVDWDGLSNKYGIDLTPPSSKVKRPSATGGVPLGTSYGKWLHDQRPKGKKFEASAAQAQALNGGKDTPGARLKAKYFNRLADKYGPDKAMKKFLREDGTELSIADLKKRYGEPERITATKVKPKPKALTKNEKIAKQVMQDPSLKSDKKRIEAMVEKGVPANSDFVGLVADAKKKSGLATTETFPKAKPKPKAKAVSVADQIAAKEAERKALTSKVLTAKPAEAKQIAARLNELKADIAGLKGEKLEQVKTITFEKKAVPQPKAEPKKPTKKLAFGETPKTTTDVAYDYKANWSGMYEKRHQYTKVVDDMDDWSGDGFKGVRAAQFKRAQERGVKLNAWEKSRIKLLDKGEDKTFGRMADRIEDFISRAPKYKGEVYRGAGFSDKEGALEYIKGMSQGGKSLTMDSWSASQGVANNFASGEALGFGGAVYDHRVVMKMPNKAGAPIETLSGIGAEKEVLQPSGIEYKVKKVTTKTTGKVTVYEVEMETI